MIPFYFGKAPRHLFGAYDPPSIADRRQGVVICNPWGQEYLLSHQSLRFLARLLSESGFHVLRFDYYGTGDSAGEPTDCTVETCLGDIDSAIEELKDMGGIERVHLVGLRLGASLAANAALATGGIQRLVLWEPVVGVDYATELAGSARVESTDRVIEANGFPLTGAMLTGMRQLAWQVAPGRSDSSVLLAGHEGEGGSDTILRALREGGIEPRLLCYDGPKIWQLTGELGVSGMPVDALRRITAWLSEER